MRCFWNYYSPWRGTAPEMYRVALCDLLAHGNVVDRHQDGALVDVASDGV